MSDLRLDAYYYGFETTGDYSIDCIEKAMKAEPQQ